MNAEEIQQCLGHLEDAAFGYVAGAPSDVVEQARKSAEKLRAMFEGKVLVPVEAVAKANELALAIHGSMNFGPRRAVKVVGDDQPSYLQRHEWCEWVIEMAKDCEAMLAASQEQKQ